MKLLYYLFIASALTAINISTMEKQSEFSDLSSVELANLATGDYEDPDIKKQTLLIITPENLPSQLYRDKLRDLVLTKEEFSLPQLPHYVTLLSWALYNRKYQLTAVLLGALNRYGQIYYNDLEISRIQTILKNFISSLSNKPLTASEGQILNLMLDLVKRKFGQKLDKSMVIDAANNTDNSKIIDIITSNLDSQ
jgi:hypothetical protein